MVRDDIETAWWYFQFNWVPLSLMGVALALSVALTDFSIETEGLLVSLGFVAVYAGFAVANSRSPVRRDPQVMFVLGSTAQIVLVTVLMTPLTYVAAAANFPLQDRNLLVVDQALGFDWRAYVAFVHDHPLVAAWLTYGYSMIRWPIFAIPVVLAAVHRYQRLQEFTLAFALALVVTTIISMVVPAIGVYFDVSDLAGRYPNLNPVAYIESVREMPLVRDGTLRQLDLFKLTGLVTFPSFHAASAALYTWALWPVPWFRWIGVVANAAMLASCPVDGAHYVIDLAAGIAVAIAAIVAVRSLSRRMASPVAADMRGAEVTAL